MLTKYIILDSSQLPLETLLFNSCKYDFKFKLGSKMSPKHLTCLSDLTDIIYQRYYDSTCQLFFFVGEWNTEMVFQCSETSC